MSTEKAGDEALLAGPGGTAPVVLRWPAEQLTVAHLATRGIPRLLLVDREGDPPVCVDPLEDWVRLPVDDRDVDARLLALRGRAERWFPSSPRPRLDGKGRLLRGSKWVALSPIEEQLSGALLEHYGEVVPDDEVLARAWPSGDGNPATLRVQVMRLRRRIAGLGLEIRTIRAKGHLLQSVEDVVPL
jgi:hypothetical protein